VALVSTDDAAASFIAIEGGEVSKVNAEPQGPACFEDLYRVHYPRIVRLCGLLLAHPHEAEDVAQEVFVKLLQASKTETRPMAWEPWLTRVTVNACRDRRRSGWWKWWRAPRYTASDDVSSVLEHISAGPTPEEEALSREVCGRIWQIFRELPARQQEVFALRYLEGWSTDAVAEALGLSIGSVKQHLFRAVHRLRAAIGEEA
jgi:RNA polymerase sigma-70 factor, ECF subfamily